MTTLLERPGVSALAGLVHEPMPRPPSRRRALAPALIAVFGFAVSATGSWIPSVWYDEAATITSATRSWPELWAEVQHVDAVHAAYYALMHVVFQLFGYSPLTLRLPSALAVGLTAALIVVLMRRLARPRVGLIAGALFCVLPRVTWMGGEGRSYAIAALLAVVVTLLLVRAMQKPSRGWWVVYGVGIALSCLFFAYLALIVVAHGCTMLALFLRARRGDRRLAGCWAVVSAAAAVALVPFVLLIRAQQSQLSWISPVSWHTVTQVFETQWFRDAGWLPWIGWLLLGFGGILLFRRSRDWRLATVLIPALIVPTLALVLVSVLYLPVYSPRYLAMCTPFVAIVMAVGIDRLRPRWFAACAVSLIALVALPHLVLGQRAPEAKENSSWSQVASFISDQRARAGAASTTAIIYGPLRYHPTATTRTIEYAYPAAFAGTIDVTLRTPAARSGGLWETHGALDDSLGALDDADRAYLVTSTRQDRRPETEAALRVDGWHVERSRHFTDVNVVEYARD